jgi:membrane-bound lytic murein transglycosylase MltF
LKKWLPILIILCLITAINLSIFTHLQYELADRDRRIEQLEKIGAKIETVNKVFGQAQKIQKHIQKRSKLSTSMAEDVTYSIIYESRCNGLEPELVTALIDTESEFNPLARSPKGACGLMQLMPSTANALNCPDVWLWRDNLAAGCKYLGRLQKRFGSQNTGLILASYNAGPSRPPSEIMRLAGNYPGKVNRCWRSIRR